MKRLMVIGIAAAAMLAGCATQQAQVQAPPQEARANSMAAMVAECAGAIKDLVVSPAGDAASKVAGVGAIERLCGAGGNQIAMQMQQREAPPQSLGSTLWSAALQVADIALRGYGIKAQRDVSIVQSNNQASTTIASYGAFSSMGASIASAGTAGYQYVQAPNTTITTLSGTGVLGSGTYTGPVTTTTTTTRTCSGASGGNGAGTTTGAPGGAGGAANC